MSADMETGSAPSLGHPTDGEWDQVYSLTQLPIQVWTPRSLLVGSVLFMLSAVQGEKLWDSLPLQPELPLTLLPERLVLLIHLPLLFSTIFIPPS